MHLTFSTACQELIRLMKNYNKYTEKEIEQVYVISLGFSLLKVKNFEQFLKRLTERLDSKGEFQDTLTEGKAALIFAYNGFIVTYLGHQKGPDLLAEGFGHRFYVEVKRYREDGGTKGKLEKALKTEEAGSSDKDELLLKEYGRGEDGSQKDFGIFCKDILVEKVNRLPQGEIGIVFIWSDDERIEKDDFKTCINMISGKPSKYKYEKQYKDLIIRDMGPFEQLTSEEKKQCEKLSGILFYSKERKAEITEQHDFCFFQNFKAKKLIPLGLAKKLRDLRLLNN